ncbi:MAG: double-strand break repair protein AddB, partial [Paracoccaceae bacterium]
MFEASSTPRVFACAPGEDFAALLVQGVLARTAHLAPEFLARVEIFVNTRRMQRRIVSLLSAQGARLLPRIRLVSDLAHDWAGDDIAPAVSPLRRRLELGQLIAQLLESQPDLAPGSALFDLADSLALLLDEMQDEGVPPDAIRSLDVTDRSGHWQRSQMFLDVVERFFGHQDGAAPGIAARQRRVTERLIANWAQNPPDHPVIVAGSTGSRGSTAMLMVAVARLPQGAIVLPGFDFDLPEAVWENLGDALSAEDHPQFRLASIIGELNVAPSQVRSWQEGAKPLVPGGNQVSSLA